MNDLGWILIGAMFQVTLLTLAASRSMRLWHGAAQGWVLPWRRPVSRPAVC